MTHGTTLRRKIGWTLLTGFVGFSGSELLDNVLNVTVAEQLIITFIIGGVTLLAQYLADVEHRFDESDRLHREAIQDLREMIRRGFQSVDEATELIAEIDRSAIHPDLLKQLIRRSSHLTSEAGPLVRALASSETQRLATTIQSLADGHQLYYDGEDREFLLALARGTSASLYATSWAVIKTNVGFEAGFWLSDLGARYLDLQRTATRRDVVARRIFIVESTTAAADPELIPILGMQRNAGIEVRVLVASDAAQDGGLSDYVIFDEQICYETTPVMRSELPGSPWRLTTRLLLNEETVRHRVQHFQELWARALPVSEDGAPMASGAEPLGPA
ncbi:hypothetical protein HH310_00145 [Actinoplanes sp. TBRC 11911]|uniref:DUF6879 family protein n=1 Tax=Actinoplanes sp. TBRC 11911 TaxID=2729386 RepID=UPI00145E1628|nr:DUF6879 family protein [Actinoplanes sp. TBRC 11911]NMO49615.1 hypothetical protein [Actinoplanes sp. TBRC 11911]